MGDGGLKKGGRSYWLFVIDDLLGERSAHFNQIMSHELSAMSERLSIL